MPAVLRQPKPEPFWKRNSIPTVALSSHHLTDWPRTQVLIILIGRLITIREVRRTSLCLGGWEMTLALDASTPMNARLPLLRSRPTKADRQGSSSWTVVDSVLLRTSPQETWYIPVMINEEFRGIGSNQQTSGEFACSFVVIRPLDHWYPSFLTVR